MVGNVNAVVCALIVDLVHPALGYLLDGILIIPYAIRVISSAIKDFLVRSVEKHTELRHIAKWYNVMYAKNLYMVHAIQKLIRLHTNNEKKQNLIMNMFACIARVLPWWLDGRIVWMKEI
jgi:hypothetical protein